VSAIFAKLGWSQVDDDFMLREVKERIMDGGTDAVTAFVDDFAGHADNIETGEATVRVSFNGYKAAGVSLRDSRINF